MTIVRRRAAVYASADPAIAAFIAPDGRCFARAWPILRRELGGGALGDRLSGFPIDALAGALCALEREFGVDLDPDEAFDLTISELIALIRRRTEGPTLAEVVNHWPEPIQLHAGNRAPGLRSHPPCHSPVGGPGDPFLIPGPPWLPAAVRLETLKAAPEPAIRWWKPRLSPSLRPWRARLSRLAAAIFARAVR
jgi:hypothetical protein